MCPCPRRLIFRASRSVVARRHSCSRDCITVVGEPSPCKCKSAWMERRTRESDRWHSKLLAARRATLMRGRSNGAAPPRSLHCQSARHGPPFYLTELTTGWCLCRLSQIFAWKSRGRAFMQISGSRYLGRNL
eukprot:3185959-Pleurochrysis_carterae.AAC.1